MSCIMKLPKSIHNDHALGTVSSLRKVLQLLAHWTAGSVELNDILVAAVTYQVPRNSETKFYIALKLL